MQYSINVLTAKCVAPKCQKNNLILAALSFDLDKFSVVDKRIKLCPNEFGQKGKVKWVR